MSNIFNNYDEQDIPFELSQMFDLENQISKYALYLWNARDELYSANENLKQVMEETIKYDNTSRHPWINIFKYSFIVIDECLDLLNLKNRGMNKYRTSLDALMNASVKRELDVVNRKYDTFLESISLTRNLTAHFDHEVEESDEFFKDFINSQENFTVTELESLPSDIRGTLYTRMLVSVYCNEKNLSVSKISENEQDELISEMIDKLKWLTKSVRSILEKLLYSYFYHYTDWFGDELSLYDIVTYDKPVSAGDGVEIEEASAITVKIPFEPPRNTDFMLMVCGDSMEPTYYDGDYLFVQSTSDIDYGENGIYSCDKKGFVKEKGTQGLISHNSKYGIIDYKNGATCMGRVLGVYKGIIFN